MFQIHMAGDKDYLGPQGIRVMSVLDCLGSLI